MAENLVLKPNILSGMLSRFIEKSSRRNGKSRNRPLPHSVLSIGVGIASGLISGLLIVFLLPLGDLPVFIGLVFGLALFGVPASGISQFYFLYKELRNREYVIGPEGVEYRDNYLDKESFSASYENVTDVSMEKPFFQRIFGTGNVSINTSGSNRDEIIFRYLKNPETVQQEISDMVSETGYRQPS